MGIVNENRTFEAKWELQSKLVNGNQIWEMGIKLGILKQIGNWELRNKMGIEQQNGNCKANW